MEQALFERLRRDGRAPIGQATKILDRVAVYSLKNYKALCQTIKFSPAHAEAAHWILLREIWAPTIYVVFLKHHAYGLGNEFRIPGNWYLPDKIDGGFQLPVSVLLDRWLRTTGLRTAYGVTKSTITRPTEKQANAWAAEKKKLENWLAGRVTPTLSDLNGLVVDYSEEVAWLDSADSWRARFLLVHVFSQACEKAETACAGKFQSPRAEISDVFTQLSAEAVWNDDDGILSDPSNYFAIRLWLKELEASGELKRIRDAMPKRISKSFGVDVTDAEIEARQREDKWAMNLGNHIAVHLERSAGLPEHVDNLQGLLARDEKLRAYLLSFAATKLNLMIYEEAKNAGEREVPRRA